MFGPKLFVPVPSRLYNMLTMEVILSTAFGRAIDVQGGKGGKLYEAAVKAFSDFSPDSQKKKMPVARMIQFLLRKPICVFPNYASTSIEARLWRASLLRGASNGVSAKAL